MIAFALLTPLILIATLGVVWKARPVHAALCLALALSLNAVLYISLGAHFIGLVQFMVYVGAVAILIVFSLLITRPKDEEEELARRPRSLVTGLWEEAQSMVIPDSQYYDQPGSVVAFTPSLCPSLHVLQRKVTPAPIRETSASFSPRVAMDPAFGPGWFQRLSGSGISTSARYSS